MNLIQSFVYSWAFASQEYPIVRSVKTTNNWSHFTPTCIGRKLFYLNSFYSVKRISEYFRKNDKKITST